MKRFITAILMCLAIAACGANGGTSNGSNATQGRSDHQVAEDLQNLMQQNNETGTVYLCSHSSGNTYNCQVGGTTLGTIYPTVTDDGTTIYASGLPS